MRTKTAVAGCKKPRWTGGKALILAMERCSTAFSSGKKEPHSFLLPRAQARTRIPSFNLLGRAEKDVVALEQVGGWED